MVFNKTICKQVISSEMHSTSGHPILTTVDCLVAFGFLTCFVFAGVTETVTEQLPGFRATSFPPETLQIFFDALATVILIFAFDGTDIPISFAKDLAGVFCFRRIVGVAFSAMAAGAGAATGAEF
jgi:hypothetical protein